MPTSNGYALSTAPERWGPLDEVPEEELADHGALWRRLRRDGYLLVRGLLDRETVLDFRRWYCAASLRPASSRTRTRGSPVATTARTSTSPASARSSSPPSSRVRSTPRSAASPRSSR